MPPPVAASFALSDLLAVVAGEGRSVRLDGALRHSGWENVVIETADGWILRFPRDDELDFDRELAILDRLQGRLPAAIPRVEWTGRRTRFAAYRALSGWHFEREAYLAADVAGRDRIAASLAEFLAAMHSSLTDAEVSQLRIPAPAGDPLKFIERRLDGIAARHRPEVETLMGQHAETWGKGAVPGPTVLLHNDFHCDNLVFEGPMGRVSGVWDFSCVQLGLPTFDFRYFDSEPRDLFERMARHYEALTGNTVDLAAATIAFRIECVSDALETGEDLDEAVSWWRLSDSGR